MRLQEWVTVVSVFTLALAIHMASCKEKKRLERNIIDPFEVYEWYPMAVAIFDQDQDGDLDCLLSKRTEFDMAARTATYVLTFGPDRQTITFHIKDGPTPGTSYINDNNGEGDWQIATMDYAESKTCSVMQFPFRNRQECILWTVPEMANRVPQSCIEHFEDICELSAPIYDENCDFMGL
ncbi:uncharacterized protein LOC144169243 [Haemaphysalis longicornis]